MLGCMLRIEPNGDRPVGRFPRSRAVNRPRPRAGRTGDRAERTKPLCDAATSRTCAGIVAAADVSSSPNSNSCSTMGWPGEAPTEFVNGAAGLLKFVGFDRALNFQRACPRSSRSRFQFVSNCSELRSRGQFRVRGDRVEVDLGSEAHPNVRRQWPSLALRRVGSKRCRRAMAIAIAVKGIQ